VKSLMTMLIALGVSTTLIATATDAIGPVAHDAARASAKNLAYAASLQVILGESFTDAWTITIAETPDLSGVSVDGATITVVNEAGGCATATLADGGMYEIASC
jgi:hypothetical protein